MTVWGIFVYFFIGTLKIIAAFVGAGIPLLITFKICSFILEKWIEWFW